MTFLNIFSKKKETSDKKEISLPEIKIDNREKNSLVPSELIALNHKIQFEQLPVADYLVSNIAIERKTISDLKSSIIKKRIFSQLLELKQFPKAFLIVEGEQEDLYNNEILSQNAIRGFLLSVITEYQIPIIFTENEKDTALYLSVLARKKPSAFSLNPKKISLNKEEQIQFILEGFPNIGPKTAEKLLSKFHSLKNIMNAEESDLSPILGKRTKDFLLLVNNRIK